MKTVDYVVQEYLEDEFDKSVLHESLFPVNIRLLKSSPFFRETIIGVAHYMEWILNQIPDDYTAPRGISGANLGIPWNIIGIKHKEGNSIYLNPVITDYSKKLVKTQSNCGSLRLKEPIEVERYEWIDLEWYDLTGNKQAKKHITRKEQGFTIQHEVEHNLGILINDRNLKR